MSFVLNDDFLLSVGFNTVPGFGYISKFGRIKGVAAAALTDVWDGGGLWVPPTTNRVHNIVSDSVNDTGLGSGANVIRVTGLDSLWNEVTEDVIMAGVFPVATANSYRRIYRMKTISSGISQLNEGNITATANVDATITAKIGANAGQTQMAIYTVPAGKTGLIYAAYATLNRSTTPAGAMATVGIVSKTSADLVDATWNVRRTVGLSVNVSWVDTRIVIRLAEKSDVRITITDVTDNNTDISAGISILLKDN